MIRLSALAICLSCVTGFAVAQDSINMTAPPAARPVSPPEASSPATPSMVVSAPALAAQLPLMTIDQEALFLKSAWGKRAHDELERSSLALATENDRLANQLSAEEQELIELRKTLPAEEFRARADEFDKRVVEVRRDRDAKARDLQHQAESERAAFFQAALPILARMMQERGAVAVLDQRVLFVSADQIDVTADLIKEIDAAEGAGPPPLRDDQSQNETGAVEPENSPASAAGAQPTGPEPTPEAGAASPSPATP